MEFLDPYVVTRTADLVPLEEVRRLEAELGVALPDDYARALTTLGKGGWCHEVGLMDPEQLRGRLEQHRQMMGEYWFWDDAVLTQAEAVRSVPVADSYNGDALVLVDGRLAWLPRDDEVALDAGTTCEQALTVLFGSGTVFTRPTIAWFASYAGERVSQNREGGDHDAVLTAVRAAFPDAPVDEDPDQQSAVVLLREVGGFVKLLGGNGAHVNRDATLTEAWERLDAALTAAGSVGRSDW
jgi:hypothetical protein